MMNMRSVCIGCLLVFGLFLVSCHTDGDSSEKPTADGDQSHADGDGTDMDEEQEPEFVPEAAARAFKLYYKERVERAIVAYNRYQLFGDLTFGITIGKAGVAKSGSDIEIVPGPNDNNMIGLSVWTAWHAYKVFRSRPLALSLIRMFNGLAFMEAVSGHPGLTARNAYPGWRLSINGETGDVTRSRMGNPVVPPVEFGSELQAEIIQTFFDDLRFTYRSNPADFMFMYMPAVEVGPYSTTYSFSMLPDYIRVSDCCTSLMQTPAPYTWEGAFWSNHNSRDNFPDLSLGYLAALEAMNDVSSEADLREAAEKAWEAGRRIGDSIQANDGKLMTVDEHNPYDTLVVAGAVRPDGETEEEDLGSLSSCPMAFVARAMSSQGLDMPLPSLPLPGSIEFLMEGLFDECHASEEVRQCKSIEEAYCGMNWGNMEELHFFGEPWLERIRQIEEETPGAAENLIGSFQDDYYEVTIAMMALVYYARLVGNREIENKAQAVLRDVTDLMRTFADIIYARTNPGRQVERRYEAALFDAWAGLKNSGEDLNDFARAEAEIARQESFLDLADSAPAPLMTNEEILQLAENHLPGQSGTVQNRYREHYGEVPPVRVSGEGYEARSYHPENEMEWSAVERPRHHRLHGSRLYEALPLCVYAPELLNCSWAALGCARPDLDGNGAVTEEDTALFATLGQEYRDSICGDSNGWCGGGDLDRSGIIDDKDQTFMTAALGCWYEAENGR